jgi:hypothetical protein
MKNIITATIIVIVCTLLSFNAIEESKSLYSGNPKVNDWTIKNLDIIQTLERKEWLAIPSFPYRKAAANAFTPEQKTSQWTQKFYECLELDWSEKEREHIFKLVNNINNDSVFYKPADIELADFDREWTKYALDSLHWSGRTIYGISRSLEPFTDKEGNSVFIRESEELGEEPDLEILKNTIRN